jgi:hypothetical protein
MYYFVANGNVGVWNGRYNAKRPWLEKMFGVSMPKDVNTLMRREWVTKSPPPVKPVVTEQPKPPVVTPPAPAPEPEPDSPANVITLPTVDVIGERPEPPQPLNPEPSMSDGLFMKALQWLPLLFGFWWRLVSWVVGLLRDR